MEIKTSKMKWYVWHLFQRELQSVGLLVRTLSMREHYQVRTLSMREHELTWRPYGYYKKRKAMAAWRRCIALKSIQIIEAKPAVDKERRLKMEFDTDSFDILIENCCSHTLTNGINDYIEPPVKSSVRVRGYNRSTNSTMVGTEGGE